MSIYDNSDLADSVRIVRQDVAHLARKAHLPANIAVRQAAMVDRIVALQPTGNDAATTLAICEAAENDAAAVAAIEALAT